MDETKGTTDWEILHMAAADIHDDLGTCAYIRHRVQKDDLVWTRNTQGNYLARVLSGWEYFTTEESRESGVGIGNVFRVTFERLTIDEVPGTVGACFWPAGRSRQSTIRRRWPTAGSSGICEQGTR